MNYVIAILSLLFAIATPAQADPYDMLVIPRAKPPLSYTQFVREVRRYENDTNALVDRLVARRVQMNLRSFGNGSDAWFAVKRDEIAFVCHSMAPGFRGGPVDAMVIRHDPGAEGGQHVFTLDRCAPMK